MKQSTGEMDKVNDSGHGGHGCDNDLPESPGVKATNKQVIDYLRQLISGLRTSMKIYKQDTDQRIAELLQKGKSNEDNITKQCLDVKDQLIVDIEKVFTTDKEYKQQVVRKVEDIEKKCKSNEDNLMRESTDLKKQLDQDISQLVTRCENIEKRLQKIEVKFEFDPEVTIVAQNWPGDMDTDVNVKRLAQRLINDTLNIDVQVVRAKRLAGRNGKPGIVKIKAKDLEDKKRILRAKSNLKRSELPDVYLCSSKSHVERLQELNTKVLLQELPNGHRYRLTANGKLVPNDYGDRGNHEP